MRQLLGLVAIIDAFEPNILLGKSFVKVFLKRLCFCYCAINIFNYSRCGAMMMELSYDFDWVFVQFEGFLELLGLS